MINNLLRILDDYLLLYPEERQRQSQLITYLENHNGEEIIDWNNFDGHIVAGGFIYAKEEHKFLVLFNKDLNMFLYRLMIKFLKFYLLLFRNLNHFLIH